MGQDYVITRIERRSEWQFNGNTMQDYAVALEGQQGWIKLTQKLETQPPREGDTLYGVIEQKSDRSGKQYLKFKKINPNFQGGGSRQQQAVSPELERKLDYAIQMLEELSGRRDLVVDPSNEPISLDDLPDPLKDI